MGQFDQLKNEEEIVGANVENTGDLSKENNNQTAETANVPSAEELKAKEDVKTENKIINEKRIKEIEDELMNGAPKSNEELKKEISEINEKILQGPIKVLKTMTPEEIRVFGVEKPNELPYLKNTLTNLYNVASIQNGTLVWENLMKYVRFLEKTRGEDYANDILPQEELQELRKKGDEIASEIK